MDWLRLVPWWWWVSAAVLAILVAMLGLFVWVLEAPNGYRGDERDNWRH